MMKISRRLLAFVLILAVFVVAYSVVPISYLNIANAAKKVSISKTKATLYVGDTLKLKMNNVKKTVKWSSGNKKVATVSDSGKVTAKKVGNVSITASVDGKKYTCKVTVKKKKLDVNDYYSKLKSYIYENGYTNNNGDKTIKYTVSSNTYLIIYEEDSERFDFNFSSSVGGSEIIDLYIDEPFNNNAKLEMYHNMDYLDYYYDKSYRVKICDIEDENDFDFVSDYSDNELINSFFDNACSGWQVMCGRAGVSLQKLGFKNY